MFAWLARYRQCSSGSNIYIVLNRSALGARIGDLFAVAINPQRARAGGGADYGAYTGRYHLDRLIGHIFFHQLFEFFGGFGAVGVNHAHALVGILGISFFEHLCKAEHRIFAALYLFDCHVLAYRVGDYYGLNLQEAAEHRAGCAYPARAL